MALAVSDEILQIFAPTVVYWLYSGIYVLMGPMEKHRLFTKEEEQAKNIATKKQVVFGVLVEQAIQMLTIALVTFSGYQLPGTTSSTSTAHESTSGTTHVSQLLTSGRQLLVALLVLDAWQYWGHRWFHVNEFLYKHVHARHHRLDPDPLHRPPCTFAAPRTFMGAHHTPIHRAPPPHNPPSPACQTA